METDNAAPRACLGNLAYVLYTSGSTDLPKAVSIVHAAVVNHCRSLGAMAFQRPPMHVACLAPVFFDAAVPQFFGALAYGHTLYLVDALTRRDPAALVAFLRRHQIALTDCTPSHLATLVEAGLGRGPHRALHTILCGGEALPSALVQSLFAAYQGAALTVVNVYGPTEYCVDAAALPITSQSLDGSHPTVPLGAPLQNTQLYILDSQLDPVPIGVPGELHIAGIGLARGYLNRPDLTAVKFIPNPFSQRPGARLYKTGDLARFLPDGNIQFLGRSSSAASASSSARSSPFSVLIHSSLPRSSFCARTLRQQLASLHPLSLPTDHPRPSLFSHCGRSLAVSVAADRVRVLKRLALDHGATLFMALLAVFQTLLARYSGQSDIAVGSPFAHRTHADTESLIGFFVNTLVLRSKLDLQRDFVTLLHHVKDVCLSAFAHQDVPFERLVSLLHVDRDLSRTPLFQVMLVLQNAPQEELRLPGLVCEVLEVENQTAKFELTLALTELADGTLGGELEYACDLWEAATIERLWGHFLVLLTAIVDNPKRPLAELPLLSETERQQMLVQWNATQSHCTLPM